MLDVQKTLYSDVQYFLIINILFLNFATMPLVEKIKNIILSLLKLLSIFFLVEKVKPFRFARA